MFALRRSAPWVTRLLLALFLFGQFSVAAQACVQLETAQAMVEAQAPCHDEVDPVACKLHCLKSDQALNAAELNAAPLAAPQPMLSVFLAPVHSAWSIPAPRGEIVAINTSPPIPILFCRFLN